MKWLLTLFNTDGEEYLLEWSGYTTVLAMDHHVTSPKPCTPFTFGLLINAPPSHPDTIVTTLDYCKNYLQSLGMNRVHITLDMQLYMVAIQVKWSDPEKWATLVMHPGGMHCVMSFLGCIGKLMRGSGLEDLIGAAFSGLTGILNRKNWPRAMRALRMVCTVLLSDFLYKEGSIPTFNDLSIVLEKACKEPTGQLWVDCLIRSTLIAHMFIRAQRQRLLALACALPPKNASLLLCSWSLALCTIRHLVSARNELSVRGCQVWSHGWCFCI